MVKGPLYLPPPIVINKLYENIQKALDNDPNKSIHLLIFKDIIDIIFKTKNTFLHNISIEKQLKNVRKKYKQATCEINDLKTQLNESLSKRGISGQSFSGKMSIKVAKFKPPIYYQARFI